MMPPPHDLNGDILPLRQRRAAEQLEITPLDAVTLHAHFTHTADLRQRREFRNILVQNRHAAGLNHRREQPRLGGKIIFHVRMVIEVIARQVGKPGSAHLNTIQTPLRQTVRGRLHCQMRYPRLRQAGKRFMQGNRFRRRHRPGAVNALSAHAERTEAGGMEP